MTDNQESPAHELSEAEKLQIRAEEKERLAAQRDVQLQQARDASGCIRAPFLLAAGFGILMWLIGAAMGW